LSGEEKYLDPLKQEGEYPIYRIHWGTGDKILTETKGGETSRGGEAEKILIRVCFIFQHAF
jgi:hypothetical protein